MSITLPSTLTDINQSFNQWRRDNNKNVFSVGDLTAAYTTDGTGVDQLTITNATYVISNVSSIATNGQIVTITCAKEHNLKKDGSIYDTIIISGASPSDYNGTWAVNAVIDDFVFSVKFLTSPPPWASGGVISYSTPDVSTLINDLNTRKVKRSGDTISYLNVSNTTEATSAATGVLVVSGGVGFAKKVWITGDLNINTNKFNITASSGNTAIAGTLGVAGDVAINTNKFNITASSGNTAIAGTLGVAGVTSVTNTTESTTSTNGSLIVSGGAGFAKRVNVSGDFNVNSNFVVTAASGNTAVSGTLGVAGDFNVNSNFVVTAASGNTSISGNTLMTGTLGVAGITSITNATEATSASVASLVVSGGAGFAKKVWITGDFNINTNKFNITGASGNTAIAGTVSLASTLGVTGVTSITNATDSSSSTTGALIVSGGAGFAKKVSIASDLNINAGKFVVSGVSGDLNVNTGMFIIAGATGNTVIAGTLSVTSDVAINTNKFNITAASGNTAIAGTVSLASTLGVSGITSITNTTDSSSSTTGALIVSGGVGFAKKVWITGDLNINTNKFNVTATTGDTAIAGNTTLAGTLSVTSDVAINTNKFNITASSGNTAIAGTLGVAGVTSITNVTDSSSSITGALIVTGGAGFAKKVYIGTDLNVAANAYLNGTSNITTAVVGVLSVSGISNLATLNATNTAITGTFGVSGTFTINTNKFSVDGASGNTLVAGTLGVTGTSTFNGAVNASGSNVSTTISPTGTGTLTINPATTGTINNVSIGATTRSTGAFTTLTSNGSTTLTAGTASTTTGTGTLVVTGGVGISGAIYAGSIQATPIGSTTTSTGAFTSLSATSGAFTTVTASSSFNKVAITQPATGSTLTLIDGKTLTVNNTLTLSATDGSTLSIGTGGTLGTAAYTAASAYATVNQVHYVGTTSIAANRVSGAMALTGITSIDGSSASCTGNAAGLSATLVTGSGGTGLSSIGTGGQILGVNPGATALEYKTIQCTDSTINIDVTSSGSVKLSSSGIYPSDSSLRGNMTVGLQTILGNKTGVSTWDSTFHAILEVRTPYSTTPTYLIAASSDSLGTSNVFTVTPAGNTVVGGTLTSTGDVAVGANKLTVAVSTGNTAVAGTLTVSGAGSFTSTLSSTNNFSVNTNKFSVVASTGNTVVAGTLDIGGNTVIQDFVTTTSTTTSNQVICSVDATVYRSAKFIIQVTNSTRYQVSEIIAIHDGSLANHSEYATQFMGAGYACESFTVDYSSGSLRLLGTPALASSTTFKITAILTKL